MGKFSNLNLMLALGALISLSACAGSNVDIPDAPDGGNQSFSPNTDRIRMGETTIWDIFNPQKAETNVAVNRYIWAASLEVLNFLPLQSVDPFTGHQWVGIGQGHDDPSNASVDDCFGAGTCPAVMTARLERGVHSGALGIVAGLGDCIYFGVWSTVL